MAMSFRSATRTVGAVAAVAMLATATGCASSLSSVSRAGDVTAVKKLLADGANPNEESDGELPLCGAIGSDQAEIVDLLLKAGAKAGVDCTIEYSDYPPL